MSVDSTISTPTWSSLDPPVADPPSSLAPADLQAPAILPTPAPKPLTPFQIEQEAKRIFLEDAVGKMGGHVHDGDIVPQQLGEAEWANTALRDKLVRLFPVLCEQGHQKAWTSGAAPCRAIAITDIGILVGVSHGGTSRKLHAEEDIAEQYYLKTRSLVVPIELMYVDLEPCHRDEVSKAEQYSGHNCALLFTTKGKAVQTGELKGRGKIRFELRSGTEPCGVYYLQEINKGANNLTSMKAEGANGILARWRGAKRLALGGLKYAEPLVFWE